MSDETKEGVPVDETEKDRAKRIRKDIFIEKMERPEPWPDPPAEDDSGESESE